MHRQARQPKAVRSRTSLLIRQRWSLALLRIFPNLCLSAPGHLDQQNGFRKLLADDMPKAQFRTNAILRRCVADCQRALPFPKLDPHIITLDPLFVDLEVLVSLGGRFLCDSLLQVLDLSLALHIRLAHKQNTLRGRGWSSPQTGACRAKTNNETVAVLLFTRGSW